jgi:adenine deaminase
MKIVSLVIIICALCPPAARSGVEPADVVFKNGNIYTVNEKQPRAEAIAVKAGKIVFVGSDQDAKAYEGKTRAWLT